MTKWEEEPVVDVTEKPVHDPEEPEEDWKQIHRDDVKVRTDARCATVGIATVLLTPAAVG